ncbi:MAG: DUF433 domain-containing protein [bacterium]|nr:DUF433 domain-containing protein [bacterium]
MNLKRFDRIRMDPRVNKGKPMIRQTGVPVATVFDLVTSGTPIATILQDNPTLEEEDIKQTMEYMLFITGMKSY